MAQTWRTRQADRLEATLQSWNRQKAPQAIATAEQLYALAAEVGGAAGDLIEQIGWACDDLANRGHEITDEQKRHAFAQAQAAHGGPY